MKRLLALIIQLVLVGSFSFAQVIADFDMPDTVCVNESINITNTSTGASTHYWNFCSGDLNTTPSGSNLGNIGSMVKPVFIAIAQDGNDYYTFVTNNEGPGPSPGNRIGTITRHAYGNSLLNIPTGTNFGNFGGDIPWGVEGIQIIKEGNNWYGIVVGGGNQSWPGLIKQHTDAIIRLDFGNSLANVPTATNMGNIGGMDFPHDLYIFQDTATGNWHGLTCNALNNTITRFDFGNSLANTPTGVNLGNIGGYLSYPDGIFPINENGNWHVFVASRDNNRIVRLDFGNSLLNIPTGTNLGNVGGMSSPRDISIIKDCDEIFGFVVNETTDDIVKLEFAGNSVTSTITGTSLGNIGNFDFPHTLSDVFREDDGVYIMVANVNNNTLSRLVFNNCSNSSIPSSTSANPPAFSYDTPGTYNVSLFVDESLPTQGNKCKPVVVINKPVAPMVGGISICAGGAATLNVTAGAGNYTWHDAPAGGNTLGSGPTFTTPALNNTTTYYVQSNAAACASNRTAVTVTVTSSPSVPPAILQVMCAGETATFGVPFPTGTYNWYDASSGGNLLHTGNSFTTPVLHGNTTYYYENVVGGCASPMSAVTAQVTALPAAPTVNGANVCVGESATLTATAPGGTYTWYDAATGGNLIHSGSSLNTGVLNVNTTYYVESTVAGCTSGSRTAVAVTVNALPTANAGANTSVCAGNSVNLNGAGGSIYAWSPAGSLNDANIALPLASPTVNTTYTLTVTDANGCVDSDQVTVTVNALPTANAGANIAVCAGTTANLNGAGGGSYAWSPAGSLNNAAVANPVANPATTTTYTLTVTDANGCIDTDQLTVTVNALPTANAGGNATVCPGGSASLSGSGAGVGGTCAWSPAGSLNDANIALPLASPTVNTTYTLTVTDVNGCVDTDEVDLTIGADLLITAGANQTICTGASVNLSANGGLNYTWSPAAGLSNANIANPVATPTATTTYSVTANDGTGCSGDTTITVVVNAVPAAPAASNVEVCIGENATLTASGNGTIHWFDLLSGGTAVHTGTSMNLTNLVADTTLFIENTLNGCLSARVPVQVLVHSLPLVDAGANQFICAGTSANLAANGGGAGATYSWSPAVSLNDANSASPIATPSVNTTYTVMVTDSNNCVGSDIVMVDIGGKLQPFAGADAEICENDAVQLSASGGVNFSWTPATGLTSTNVPNPIASPATTTTYTVSVDDGQGCFGDTTVTVVVNNLPALAATPSTSICLGDSINLNVSGADNYSWLPITGLNTANGATVVAAPLGKTTYTISATDAKGCAASTTITVDVNTPSVQIQRSTIAICEGDSAFLHADGAATYQWTPATDLNVSNAASVIAQPNATITYTVIGLDSLGCSATANVTVSVESVDAAFTVPNACLGDAVSFTDLSSGVDNWDWNFGDGNTSTQQNPSHTFNNTGTFTVSLSVVSSLGCRDTFSTTIMIDDVLADFSTSIDEGEGPLTVDFSDLSSNAVSLSWDFGDGNGSTDQDPTHTFDQSGEYTVYLDVVSANGCKDVATHIIKVKKPTSRLNVPNVFTPNNDGSNDIFTVDYKGISEFKGVIFNRWGELIYSWERAGQDWDGRTNTGLTCSEGTYFYIITAEGVDGEQYENEGFVTLLR